MNRRTLIIAATILTSACFRTVATHSPAALRSQKEDHTLVLAPTNLPVRRLPRQFNTFIIQLEPNAVRSFDIVWENSYHQYGSARSSLMPVDESSMEPVSTVDATHKETYFVLPRDYYEKSIKREGWARELAPLPDGRHVLMIEYSYRGRTYSSYYEIVLGTSVKHIPIPKLE